MLPRWRRSRLGLFFLLGVLCWLVLTVRIMLHNHPAPVEKLPKHQETLPHSTLITQISNTASINISLIIGHKPGENPAVGSKAAVLLLGCNRPEAVKRSLDQLLRHRPVGWETSYPVLVSLDCANRQTEAAAAQFENRLAGLLKQPDLSTIKMPRRERGLIGYYKIARHFRWALDQVFLKLNYTAAIIVEDDLDVAPDFYTYFDHLGPLLNLDPTVWCISAWNDNGKSDLIDPSRSDLFYRTDFFPGLGWMLARGTWLELRSGWPPAYWDDHLRKAEVRRNRSCIRPEVSRTYTFGRVGVSHGQHFDSFLRHIRLHNVSFNYSGLSLSHLTKSHYDANLTRAVYRLPLAPSVDVAMRMSAHSNGVRVEYGTREGFLLAAKRLGMMADFKHGVPRCAFDGVVPVFKAGRRIYLAPKLPWSGYDARWKT